MHRVDHPCRAASDFLVSRCDALRGFCELAFVARANVEDCHLKHVHFRKVDRGRARTQCIHSLSDEVRDVRGIFREQTVLQTGKLRVSCNTCSHAGAHFFKVAE